jgi:DNA-binding beta-propeller fold protein YncE
VLALIYLALAIAFGDLLCRRFYRFVSVSHRCAAATLVGLLLSTWFTYLAGVACYRTAEPLLWADIQFFVASAAAIVWLSKKSPKVQMIEPGAPGRAVWDWITLGALFVAMCILLIGTLYVNKQGRIRLSGIEISDFGPHLAIAQDFALGHNFPAESPYYAGQAIRSDFRFYFQSGNLEFLGLNLAWSVDVLSVLVLTSTLALVMALGELLFNSRVVGRLGAALFFFHGSLRHLTNFLASGHPDRGQTWGFWKQSAFVNQRHLPLAIGIFLLVLIFLVDRYHQRSPATGTTSDATIALREPMRRSNWNQLKRNFASRFITSARPTLTPPKSFVFSGLLLAALPVWNAHGFIAVVAVLCCLFVAYCCWWSSRVKPTAILLGRVLTGTLTACILAAGVIDLWAVYSSSGVEVNSEKEPLVKGLVFRNSVIYKIQGSVPSHLAPEGPPKPPVTAFQGGHGNGKGQFDRPRGIAIDSAGNIFIADTNNGRIEKFSPSGVFITSIGTSGKGHGQFGAPNGLAVDRFGDIYVAEVSNNRVQKLGPDGTFIAEWAPGFYGPRRIAIGPDCAVYVLDQGRTRIVKFSPDGRALITWGSAGSGDGQFADHTSVAVDPTSNKVYVADPRNSRIQIFDSDGKFLAKWSVPEWGQPAGFEDLAIDSRRGRLYASSAHINTILVFDLQGNRTGTLMPSPPDKINGPSALALSTDKLFVLSTGSARVSVISLPAR